MDAYTACEQAYKNGYEAGSRDAVHWISVKDRLPDAKEEVLVFREDGEPSIEEFYPAYLRWSFDDMMYGSVTHWMPLPNPPEVPHEP